MKTNWTIILLCITILASVFIFSNAIVNRNKRQNMITVTGLGKKDFTSDLIVWQGAFSRKNMELKVAYEDLQKDRASIKSYLISKGIEEKSIVFSSVDIDKEFNQVYQNGNYLEGIFTGYRLDQRVQIESKEVDKIENLSREVTELINTGVEFNSYAPQYYYTKLDSLKIEMVAQATRDGRQRAEKIAQNAGSGLGSLKNAQMGVFQITAPNSNEDYSWGGVFNTSSREKTAAITMKLQFGVR